MKKKNIYVSFFPTCENVHLIKDPGMIPYIFHRDHGYKGYILTYQNGKYPSLKKDTSGLKIIYLKKGLIMNLWDKFVSSFMKKKGRIAKFLQIIYYFFDFTIISSLVHYLENYKLFNNIFQLTDIFQIYHNPADIFIIGRRYKKVKPNGKIYWKLDSYPHIKELYLANPSRYANLYRWEHLNKYLKMKIDLIGIETKHSLEFLKLKMPFFRKYKSNIYYIPNGIDIQRFSKYFKTMKKENTIIHVGRIGSPEKRTEVAIESFQKISKKFSEWKLILIGPVEESFKEKLQVYIQKNKSIISVGKISDIESMCMYYNEAKIIIIPSLYESFCFVAVEAGFFKNIIIGSNIPALFEKTDNGKLGYMCPINDVESFSSALEQAINNDIEIQKKGDLQRKFIIENYDWTNITSKILEILNL